MSRPALLPLPAPVEEQLRRVCEEQYPHEACGALFGEGDGSSAPWRVTELRSAPNEHEDDRARRYLVPPEFQLQAERHAQATDQEVLGYFHSHPDHPAQPSEYDRSHAWLGYLYLICSVQKGRATELNAFALEEQGGRFGEVEVRSGTGQAQPAPAGSPGGGPATTRNGDLR
jgi:proteasome lid subunit RPN8/RPN11